MSSNTSASRPIVVGIGGRTSEVGKTTLLCELLRAFPGWEAIKTTRGHYRSCGKDPHACCVSDLLEEKPVIHTGRALTYVPGKDTGRYWDAGAANVHWLIATDAQVDAGIKEAINRVKTGGVFVEGNSFTQYVEPDFFIMVARADKSTIKTTAKKALSRASAIYVSGEIDGQETDDVEKLTNNFACEDSGRNVPLFCRKDLPKLISQLRQVVSHAGGVTQATRL